MREIAEKFERKHREDRINGFEVNTNVMTDIKNVNSDTVRGLANLESAIHEDKMLIKQDGVMKELVLDEGQIILQEIS
jgi:hypothetical protein